MKPVVLTILDGWGIRESERFNAAKIANTPNLDHLFETCTHARLEASGQAVGLPKGQQGNSEVGHLNLGAGRIVYQDLERINLDIETGAFDNNPVLNTLFNHIRSRDGALHFMGLLSDGGVHSHQEHLYALLTMAKEQGLDRVFVHAFTDGRDVSPTSGVGYVKTLEAKCGEIGCGTIATVSGRYYAMDRDKRYDRVEKAWRAVVLGKGETADNPVEALQASYAEGITDEFVVPTVIRGVDGRIQPEDGVVFFNFRADRAKQMAHALVDPAFNGFARGDFKPVELVSMTEYEAILNDYLEVAWPPLTLENTLGEWLSSHGKHQLRVAETEKYAHVTSFFNGGVEAASPGEDRVLIASPKVATYDLQPEMSAESVCDAVVDGVKSTEYDFILVNFANPDMVGHTGVLEAAVAAVETVDKMVKRISDAVLAAGGAMLICADHGNCEKMANEDGSPFTSHTTNPVPIILLGAAGVLHDGKLADVAPTVLDLMGMDIPEEMTGTSLLA